MRAGNKALRFAAAALMGLSLMACGGAKQSASVSEPVEINLSEKSGQEEVSAALAKAGIPESDIQEFQREVERFQTAVGDATTEDDMADRWEKAYPDFVGTNCRITAFMLGNSLVKVDGGSGDGLSEKENLAFDMEALQKAPETLWDSSQNDAFARLFAEVPAADTKDVAEQVKQVQKAWKERGISFAEGKPCDRLASLQDYPGGEHPLPGPRGCAHSGGQRKASLCRETCVPEAVPRAVL